MGIETNELYYYRARYYDASIQRFLSLDPIGFLAGDFNFYRYVGNSPTNFNDPLGFKGIDLGGVIRDKGLKKIKDKINELDDELSRGDDHKESYFKVGKCSGIADLKFPHEENFDEKAIWISKHCTDEAFKDIANDLYDALTPSVGIPYTDIGVQLFPRDPRTDANITTEFDGVVMRPPTQEELAASRQRIYDAYGDGSETGVDTQVCQSYDYLIDKKTPGNVVGNYEDQREVCIFDAESTPNPNYNVPYEYNDSPNFGEEYSYDDHPIQSSNDNKTEEYSNDDNKTKDK